MASEFVLSALVLLGLGVNLLGSITIVSPNLPILESAGLVVQHHLRQIVPGMSTDYRRLSAGFQKVKADGLRGGGEERENEEFTELLAYLASPEMVEQAGIPKYAGEEDVTDIGDILDKLEFQNLARHMQAVGGTCGEVH